MVTQRRTRQLPLRSIDLAGGCVVIACLGGFLWILFVGNEQVRAEGQALRGAVRRAERELGEFTAAVAAQRAALDRHKSAVEKTGTLPTLAPVELYFRTLSTAATGYGLQLRRHHAIAPRRYAGLLEQRFTYKVSGPTRGLFALLRYIEQADFWADVAYLSIDRGRGPEPVAATQRVGTLTISMFSTPSDTNVGVAVHD